MSTIIAPSVLSMNFADMVTQLKKIEVAGAQWIHYDVMDGIFVNNISFGPEILRQIKNNSELFMDVHLMISDPVKYYDVFIENGADAITSHVECFGDATEGIEAMKYLKNKGIKAGITLKPSTPLEHVLPYLKHVDIVLVMSVEPGFGGQAFIPEMYHRIEELKKIKELNKYEYAISVDGGINNETASKAKKAGGDVLVAGSYVFKDNIEKAVASLL